MAPEWAALVIHCPVSLEAALPGPLCQYVRADQSTTAQCAPGQRRREVLAAPLETEGLDSGPNSSVYCTSDFG